MTQAWREFFKSFPEYRNTFKQVETREKLVILYKQATWSKGESHNHAIWTATIEQSSS